MTDRLENPASTEMGSRRNFQLNRAEATRILPSKTEGPESLHLLVSNLVYLIKVREFYPLFLYSQFSGCRMKGIVLEKN